MFGLFKKNNNTPEENLFDYFKTELEKSAINNYKKSPMRGTPLEGYAILEGLNNSHSLLASKMEEISRKFNVSSQNAKVILTKAFQNIHDKLII